MEIKRVFDLLPLFLSKNARPDALVAKENGTWKKYSTNDFVDYVNHLSYGLFNIGINKNDKIAIISNNRPEWNFADYASQQCGAISVPIYPTISLKDLIFIFLDSRSNNFITFLFPTPKINPEELNFLINSKISFFLDWYNKWKFDFI